MFRYVMVCLTTAEPPQILLPPDTSKLKYLTLRRLMSYIYGAPILDVSRSHNDAAQSVGLLWTSDQLVAETST